MDFAFETTPAGRGYARWLRGLRASGYECHLVFLWLDEVETAIARVRGRVAMGGHSIPESVLRRRYRAGLRNFFDIYRSLADVWRFYDNSSGDSPTLVAEGAALKVTAVHDKRIWQTVLRRAKR